MKKVFWKSSPSYTLREGHTMTGHEKPGSNTLAVIISKLASLSWQIYILLASNAWTIPEKDTNRGVEDILF